MSMVHFPLPAMFEQTGGYLNIMTLQVTGFPYSTCMLTGKEIGKDNLREVTLIQPPGSETHIVSRRWGSSFYTFLEQSTNQMDAYWNAKKTALCPTLHAVILFAVQLEKK